MEADDSGFVYFASYTYFTYNYFTNMPNMGNCAGEEFTAFAGMGILTSYLLLFISFYLATYKKPMPKGRKRTSSALSEMSAEQIPTVGEVRRRFSHGQDESPLATGKSPNGVPRSRKA